jgi:hypothetical protein
MGQQRCRKRTELQSQAGVDLPPWSPLYGGTIWQAKRRVSFVYFAGTKTPGVRQKTLMRSSTSLGTLAAQLHLVGWTQMKKSLKE